MFIKLGRHDINLDSVAALKIWKSNGCPVVGLGEVPLNLWVVEITWPSGWMMAFAATDDELAKLRASMGLPMA